jgi:hypothetical protein
MPLLIPEQHTLRRGLLRIAVRAHVVKEHLLMIFGGDVSRIRAEPKSCLNVGVRRSVSSEDVANPVQRQVRAFVDTDCSHCLALVFEQVLFVAEMSKPEVSAGGPNVLPAIVARPGARLRKQVHRLLHRIFEFRVGLTEEVRIHARVVALLDQIREYGAGLQAAGTAAEQEDIRIAVEGCALLVRGWPEASVCGFLPQRSPFFLPNSHFFAICSSEPYLGRGDTPQGIW